MQKNNEVISENRKARHDYEITDSFEVGIILLGPEVKSARNKSVNLSGSYIVIRDERVFLQKAHFGKYKNANIEINETKERELLLKKSEISKLEAKISQQGITIVPLRMYFKAGLIKMEIGIAKGRKQHDKRDMLKKRDNKRDAARAVKR